MRRRLGDAVVRTGPLADKSLHRQRHELHHGSVHPNLLISQLAPRPYRSNALRRQQIILRQAVVLHHNEQHPSGSERWCTTKPRRGLRLRANSTDWRRLQHPHDAHGINRPRAAHVRGWSRAVRRGAVPVGTPAGSSRRRLGRCHCYTGGRCQRARTGDAMGAGESAGDARQVGVSRWRRAHSRSPSFY